MHKRFLLVGALSGAIAVSLGAFGAHGLKQIVSATDVAVFQTGVQYQMYHTLALMLLAIVYERLPSKWITTSACLFAFGVLFFSGSLYLITALKATGATVPVLVGAITPLGGLCFISGWLCFFIGVIRKN
jgi:uncharacterized membrane protein YgdD (TMEM256/DUF423 family)